MMDRDDIMARREELMAKAAEIREQFAENVETDMVASVAGWTLMSAGLAVGVALWVRGRRSILALLLPIGLIVGGSSLLGGGMYHRRGIRISEAEQRIVEELAVLDPIARMRVLRDAGKESLPFVHSHN